jgi:hypothetical protein
VFRQVVVSLNSNTLKALPFRGESATDIHVTAKRCQAQGRFQSRCQHILRTFPSDTQETRNDLRRWDDAQMTDNDIGGELSSR